MRDLRPVLIAFGIALWPLACEHGHGHEHAAPSASALPAGVNPVQNEMRVLHEATRDWVTAVANNELDKIPASIEKIHAARSLTEKALSAGTYKPPKNADRVGDFERQDAAFHDQLVKLLLASKSKDLPAATGHLGRVLEGCTDCHTKYRF